MQYIVLFPISPEQGPLIMPAEEGDPPTVVDEDVLFATPSDLFTREERAKLLMDRGIIVPADTPERVHAAREALKDTERQAARSLRSITTHKE